MAYSFPLLSRRWRDGAEMARQRQGLTGIIFVTTINAMGMKIVWDKAKRAANLDKHGLDFTDAVLVLESPYRLDVMSVRGAEPRTQSFAYVFDVLAVLTVVHVARDDALRLVSFRPASEVERSVYHDWLENDFNDN
jgi:uncharacterized protein